MAGHDFAERIRVTARIDPGVPAAVTRSAVRTRLVVLGGACIGLVTGAAMSALPPRLAPLAVLLAMGSTLAAGRLASLGAALAHGACAWASLAGALAGTGYLALRWCGLPAAWILFVLIEDMALLGRIGRRPLPSPAPLVTSRVG